MQAFSPRFLICWITFQVPSTARAGQGQSQQLITLSGPPIWVQSIWCLQWSIGKLELSWDSNPSSPIWDAGTSSGRLTHCTKNPLLGFFLILHTAWQHQYYNYESGRYNSQSRALPSEWHHAIYNEARWIPKWLQYCLAYILKAIIIIFQEINSKITSPVSFPNYLQN